jgi:predicted  nucleic acid-binding Zn-ribbon protein
MAEAPLPGSDDYSAIYQMIQEQQGVVAQAIFQLSLLEAQTSLDPTAANLEAEHAQQANVTVQEVLLANLNAEVAATVNTPTSGPGSPGYGIVTAPTSGPGSPGWGILTSTGDVPVTGVILAGTAGVESGWSAALDDLDSMADLSAWFDSIGGTAIDAGGAVIVAEVGGGLLATIADLPTIALAAGCVLIIYCVGKILIFVGRYFGNPGVFGWHPLNFIQAGIQDVGRGLVSVADGIIDPIIHLIMTPVHLLLGLFQRSGNATASAHNKIASVVNTHIPAAELAAEQEAAKYTDTSIATLDSDLSAKITDANNTIADLQRSLPAMIASGATAAFATIDADLLSRLSKDENAMAAISTEIATQLPLEIQTAVSDAQATEQQALTAATTQLQSQITAINTQIGTVQGQIATTLATITALQTQLNTLESATNPDQAQITALQQEITTAEDDYNQLVVTLDDLNNQITGISTTLGNVQTAQQLQTTQLNGITGLGATGLVAVVAALVTGLTSLTNYVDTCVVQTCDETKPTGLKPSLLALLALLTDAAEIAAISAMIKDPVGSADTLAPTLDATAAFAINSWDVLLDL